MMQSDMAIQQVALMSPLRRQIGMIIVYETPRDE